jgi:Ion channel
MLLNITIASLMMIATTAIHAAGINLAVVFVHVHNKHHDKQTPFYRLQRLGGVVLLMFFLSIVEVSAWAAVYILGGAFQKFEPALYFSTVTFTTLGYGDILLQESWRLVAAFEAANGIIIFGLTTAVVVATVQRLYFPQPSQMPSIEQPDASSSTKTAGGQ